MVAPLLGSPPTGSNLRPPMPRKSKYPAISLEREDRYGKLRLMTFAEGYVMARRKGGKPFVVTIDEWVEIRRNDAVVPLRPIS